MRDKKQIIQDLYRALELQKAPESLYRISKNINYRSQNLGSLLELMEFIKELPPIKREKRGKITYLSIGSLQSKEKATAETMWEVSFENWTAKIQYSAVVEFWSFVKMEFQEELASSGLLGFASSWGATVLNMAEFFLLVLQFFETHQQTFGYQEVDFFPKPRFSTSRREPLKLHLTITLPPSMRTKAEEFEALYFNWDKEVIPIHPYSTAFWLKST